MGSYRPILFIWQEESTTSTLFAALKIRLTLRSTRSCDGGCRRTCGDAAQAIRRRREGVGEAAG